MSKAENRMEAAVERPEFQVEPLPRDTLQDRVYRQVAGLILDGGIAPGQLVTIQSLADSFGVSAMPVREALKRLTALNALTVVSGRSMGIPPLTLDRLTDLRNVRIEVEGTAAAWAAEKIDARTIAELESQLEDMQRSIDQADTRAFLRANRALHFTIYRASGSPTMTSLIEMLWLHISPYFNLLRASGNYVIANRRHQEMVEGLKRRDSAAVRAAVVADINAAYDVLAETLA